MAVGGQPVFDEKRNLVRQAELDTVRQAASLAEVDEVLEGECKSDRLGEVDLDVLLGLVDVCVVAQCHGAVTNVALARELDALLCGFD